MMTQRQITRKDLENLVQGLQRDYELPSELIGDILELAAVLAGMAGMSPLDKPILSPHKRQIVSGASIILTPEPASVPRACTKIVGVYLAEKGYFKKQFTPGKGLEALMNYYRCCQGIVRVGLVVSETWNPRTLGRFKAPIEYYESMGIRTIFVLRATNRLMSMNCPWQ